MDWDFLSLRTHQFWISIFVIFQTSTFSPSSSQVACSPRVSKIIFLGYFPSLQNQCVDQVILEGNSKGIAALLSWNELTCCQRLEFTFMLVLSCRLVFKFPQKKKKKQIKFFKPTMNIQPNYISIAFDTKSIFITLMFLLAILGYAFF